MANWKTTTVAVLTALITLGSVAKAYLLGDGLDANTAVQSVIALLVAVGLWKAADAREKADQ